MPDSLRFIVVIGGLAALVYGAAWALAHFPPEQTEIVRTLPHENLRPK